MNCATGFFKSCLLAVIVVVWCVGMSSVVAQSQPAGDKLDEIENQVKALQKLVEEMRAGEGCDVVERDRVFEWLDFDGCAGR